MAPKRGGGSHSSGGISFSSSQCSDNGAFSYPSDQVYIAMNVIVAFFFIVTLVLWTRKRKQSPSVKRNLSWLFCVALVFQILSYIITIIIYTLSQCGMAGTLAYYKTNILVLWLGYVGDLFFMATIVFKVIPALWASTNAKARMPTIANSALLALTTVILVAWLGVNTYEYSTDNNFTIPDGARNGLLVTFDLLWLLLSIMIGVFMLLAANKHTSSGSLKLKVFFFALCLFGWRLSSLVLVIHLTLLDHDITLVGFIVETVIVYLLSFLPYVLLLLVANSPAINPADTKPFEDSYAPYSQPNPYQGPIQQPIWQGSGGQGEQPQMMMGR